MKRTISAAVSIAAMALAVTGCSAQGDGDDVTIGVSMSTLENPFFNLVSDAAASYAEEQGVESIVTDAQNDTQQQLNDVQDLITRGADVIVLNPVEPESATPIVELANDRDIPIITVDRSSAGGEVASHIASDNVEGGRLICEWLAEHIDGAGDMAVLEGISGTSPELDRDEGCDAALTDYPDITEVASQPADWDRELGYTVAQNILQANPDLTAIFGRNDLAALGAVEATQQAGMLEQVTIVGFDGIADAFESIAAGDLDATIAQDPALMGETSIDTALAILDGDDVEAVQDLPVTVVDSTNVDDYLE